MVREVLLLRSGKDSLPISRLLLTFTNEEGLLVPGVYCFPKVEMIGSTLQSRDPDPLLRRSFKVPIDPWTTTTDFIDHHEKDGLFT